MRVSAGVFPSAAKPPTYATPIEFVREYIELADLVTVMTVAVRSYHIVVSYVFPAVFLNVTVANIFNSNFFAFRCCCAVDYYFSYFSHYSFGF